MPASDLPLLIATAIKAAEIALPFVDKALDVQYKDGDKSPVTDADFAVNALMEQKLRTARPDYGWLSEESTDDAARLSKKRVFVVDPIDGTRAFIEGSKSWAHALAVVEDGRVTAAVVHLPRLGKTYAASEGRGASLNGQKIRCGSVGEPLNASALAARNALAAHHWTNGAPDLARSYRPSLAYRLCLVAEGRYDSTFTFRPTWEWDIACGALILSEAGAVMTDHLGQGISFNAPVPQAPGLLAANPVLHGALRKCIGDSE